MLGTVESLLPVLVHIQAHLDDDLSLEHVAGAAGHSPYHFHRMFKQATGETLQKYVERLRLERAAHQLAIQDTRVIDLAFELGYNSHETFTRAFRRHFSMSPSAYRRSHRYSSDETPSAGSSPQESPRYLNVDVQAYELSKVVVRRLDPLPVAFIRMHGPYVDVDVGAYDRLIVWARENGQYRGDNLLLGVGHDNPTVTPLDKLRFDACISVSRRFSPQGEIGYQELPGGTFASATYVGPYGPTLESAYGEMFERMLRMQRYTILGLPVIEIYHTTRIRPDYALNHTTIYIPVQPKGG